MVLEAKHVGILLYTQFTTGHGCLEWFRNLPDCCYLSHI
jgi:hypothetical protein